MLEITPALPASRAALASLAHVPYRPGSAGIPPARPHGPDSVRGLAFHELESAEQFAQVRHLRSEIQLPEAVRGDPGFATREKKRDESGFVGAFALDGRYIGTIRLVPLGLGLAPCETVIARHPQLPSQILDDGWEVGRLVLHPDHRSPELLKSCFHLTLMRFIESYPTANFFATCNPLLARLYRRFGFSTLVKDACRNEGESYQLIHGNVASVRLAVARDAQELRQ